MLQSAIFYWGNMYIYFELLIMGDIVLFIVTIIGMFQIFEMETFLQVVPME